MRALIISCFVIVLAGLAAFIGAILLETFRVSPFLGVFMLAILVLFIFVKEPSHE